jgi:uncharacterized protein (TIGR02118 family)
MTVLVGLIQKKPDWTSAEFDRRWRGHHATLTAQLPGLVRGEHNYIHDHVQRGITFQRGPEQLDAFSMLWFDNDAAMSNALASPAGLALAADEMQIIANLRTVTIDQREVIRPATDRPLIKRMSLLRRRSDVTADQFLHEWRIEHARLVCAINGVRGYRQNFVLSREAPKGNPVDYDDFPLDGIVELWFDDIESLNTAFASPQGVALMTHAREFIEEITSFLVDLQVVA